jgi:hypothetical protein
VNGDYSQANIIVRSRIVGSAETKEAMQKIEEYGIKLFGDDAKVGATGTIKMVNKSADEVAVGQMKGILTCLVVIFILMSLLFKSPRVGFLTMLPNIFPIIVLFGVMGFTGITLNFSTGIIACIAIGLGLDDTIHFMSRYDYEMKRATSNEEALRRTIRIVGKPIIYTSMSLFAGFIIIAGSDFVPLFQFGILSAMSIIACLIADLALLPALIPTVKITMLWDYLDLGIGRQSAAETSVFKGLGAPQAKTSSLMCVFSFYRKGETIVEEGEISMYMYVVLEGRVKAVKTSGGREDVVERISEGMHFGSKPGTELAPSPVAWIAETSAQVLVINSLSLDRLKANLPAIGEQKADES